jgi:hypothetical protein
MPTATTDQQIVVPVHDAQIVLDKNVFIMEAQKNTFTLKGESAKTVTAFLNTNPDQRIFKIILEVQVAESTGTLPILDPQSK